MHRRQFLRLTGGSAAVAALTVWLAPGCSRRVIGSAEVPPAVPPAGDRPLLLVLVPKDEYVGYHRGRDIGAVLNHGGDAVLADFAGVDLVCAGPDRLPAEARAAVAAGDPWFVLVTRDGATVTARAYTPELPPEPPKFPSEGQTWEQLQQESRARVDVFAAGLHAFLAPSVGAPGDVAARAETARKRYVKRAPAGTHWGHSGGCGITYEGIREQSPPPACGMGMVPEVSQRFLDFYIKG